MILAVVKPVRSEPPRGCDDGIWKSIKATLSSSRAYSFSWVSGMHKQILSGALCPLDQAVPTLKVQVTY